MPFCQSASNRYVQYIQLFPFDVRDKYYNTKTVPPIRINFLAPHLYTQYGMNELIRMFMRRRIESVLLPIHSSLKGEIFHHMTLLFGSPVHDWALPVADNPSVAFLVIRWINWYDTHACVTCRRGVMCETAMRLHRLNELWLSFQHAEVYQTGSRACTYLY
jgi:hypothetical protein